MGASPCGGCRANCCRQNGHEYAVLLRGEEVRKFAPFAVAVRIGVVTEYVLPYVAGRCQFLGENGLCAIYEDRPGSCREFECVRYFNAHGVGAHGRFLELNPDVRERIEGM